MISGLNSMDFSALCGLGEASLSKSELIGMARPLLSSVFDDGQIDTLFGAISSKYRFVKNPDTPTTDQEGRQFKSDMEGFTRKSLSWSQLATAATSEEFRKQLESAFTNLAASWSSQGIYVVPLQRMIQSPSSGSSLPSVSAVTDQVFSFASTSSSPVGVTAKTTGAPVSYRRQSLPVRRITQSSTTTALEKKRLVWIIGGFSVIFAIAIGAIAARSE